MMPHFLVPVLLLALADASTTSFAQPQPWPVATVFAPTAYGDGQGGYINGTNTMYPLLAKQLSQTNFSTLRYQQVYNRSLFTNLASHLSYSSQFTNPVPDLVYLTTVGLVITASTNSCPVLTVPSVQVNLSTTTNSADHLNPVFAENVGPDDMVFWGPAVCSGGFFQGKRPFKYDPSKGNLLVDVRVLDGDGPTYLCMPPLTAPLWQQGINSATDEVSRVWATNVNATVASGMDTIGVETSITFVPIPSLRVEFSPIYGATNTNSVVQVTWPAQPTNFALQWSPRLGAGATWGPPPPSQQYQSNWVVISPGSANATGFYRLFWSGQ